MRTELRQHVEETLQSLGNEAELRPFSTWDFGRERDTNCLSVVLPEEEAWGLLPDLRYALQKGLVAFLGTNRWLGAEKHEGIELVIAEAESQFDMVHIARTDPVNAGMDAEDVISRLKTYDEKYGISILQATTAVIEFTLYTLPPDLSAFSEDIYDFCGDVEDPSFVEARVRTLMRVFLWWD